MSEKRSNSDKSKDTLIDQVFFNKFKIIQKIGEGSFGNVYSAQSIYSHKLYAVKLEPMKDSNILEEESLILSYISSPRIPGQRLRLRPYLLYQNARHTVEGPRRWESVRVQRLFP